MTKYYKNHIIVINNCEYYCSHSVQNDPKTQKFDFLKSPFDKAKTALMNNKCYIV